MRPYFDTTLSMPVSESMTSLKVGIGIESENEEVFLHLQDFMISKAIVVSAVQDALKEDFSVMLLHFLVHDTLVAEAVSEIIKNSMQARMELSQSIIKTVPRNDEIAKSESLLLYNFISVILAEPQLLTDLHMMITVKNRESVQGFVFNMIKSSAE
ncbi:hypothetical protein AJ78_06892 [Emergomyces pasteurianus Ep9510]|uniref:Uncharacterized protein n=1 Tax=Emergomyces pasteurianus Ep9510 TaxID=1447872 RepID=A0A1J9Q8M1_9EURO|nr:hypothetical protein AJ78_06892 [Emergomyces pasteurianus Ep9510]